MPNPPSFIVSELKNRAKLGEAFGPDQRKPATSTARIAIARQWHLVALSSPANST